MLAPVENLLPPPRAPPNLRFIPMTGFWGMIGYLVIGDAFLTIFGYVSLIGDSAGELFLQLSFSVLHSIGVSSAVGSDVTFNLFDEEVPYTSADGSGAAFNFFDNNDPFSFEGPPIF